MAEVCTSCGRDEIDRMDLDSHGMCFDCRIRSTLGPDLTCAIVGRGDQGNERVRGIDAAGRKIGCCPICHFEYFISEIFLTDGRWLEACCTVEHALRKRGKVRWSPGGDQVHANSDIQAYLEAYLQRMG